MGEAVDTIPSILNKCLFVSPDERTDVPTFIFLLDILHVRKVSNNTKRTQQYPLLLRIKSYFQRL